jgi:hypothetical protein
MSKKTAKVARGVGDIVAAIQAHLAEVSPGREAPKGASETDLAELAAAAGAPLNEDLLAFFRASDGVELPGEVPGLPSLCSAREAIEETKKVREVANAPALVVLAHQDFESSVPAVSLDGDLVGQAAPWDSVEGHFDELDAQPLAAYLASYLKTLEGALPTPKQLAAAVSRVAKDGRAGNPVDSHFERAAQPHVLLRAVLEGAADAPKWVVTRFQTHALDRALRRYSNELPVELVVSMAGKLVFAGTTTLLEGYSPLADTLLAHEYLRDPEVTARIASTFEGPAKDGWLLMQRRMGLVPVSAISDELRARLAASPRNYNVSTPKDGAVVQSTAAGIAGLEPYFESRERIVEALRSAPPAAATSVEVAALVLGDAPSVERLVAVANASLAHVGQLDDELWHALPIDTLVAAAGQVAEGDWLAWVCVGHPKATPETLLPLAPVLVMPSDPDELTKLPPELVEAMRACQPQA